MKGRGHGDDFDKAISIKFVFKSNRSDKKLSDEESQLLHVYIGEILGEVEIEEKRIIEEERRAALEVTARNYKQEE